MRLPPRSPSRVVWEEGMYLAPHHFQAQRRHAEETVVHTVASLFPYAFGLTSVSIDAEALASGTLALQSARGIMPDGTTIAIPDADPVPPPSSLINRFSPDRDAHVIHLALPHWRSDSSNVRLAEEAAGLSFGAAAPENGEPRFDEVIAEVRDETSGVDAVAVHFAAKHLRLALDSELRSDEITLPVARLRRDGAGRFVLDPEFIPPCLSIAASERLIGMLRRVVQMLEAKGAALASTLVPASSSGAASAPVAYVGNELATLWLLHAVRSAEAPLRHLLATRRAHPEEMWHELSRLAGALCTFSLTLQARDLPLYAHDDLSHCFAELERHLREHLDVAVAAKDRKSVV